MADYAANTSDESLLERAKDGDKSAFDIFYNRHKRRILNYVYRMIGRREAAEEITQDVFMKAYMNLTRYIAQGKALNWIYTIAGNLCKNFFRDNRYKKEVSINRELLRLEGLSLEDMIEGREKMPSDSAMNREMEDLIQEHVNRLPIKYKAVLVLCDIQGCSYEDAAKILKCRVGSVGSRLSRARLFLAESLGKYFKNKKR
ncbi:MAG: RNA polymerase sigma factor [Candidatus Omnitrophica bacterium]|nr:RNA polymerase sigma factor [Candidatus Omnitrophota bacterium]